MEYTVPPPIDGSIGTITITLIAPKAIVQWSPPLSTVKLILVGILRDLTYLW